VETAGTELGMTYEPLAVEVTVLVQDAGNGELAFVTEYDKAPQFDNTYAASGSWVAHVIKSLEGRELKADEFTFELKDCEGKVVATAKNDAKGKVVFDEIVYDETAIGTVTQYTITEVKGTELGMTYDPLEVTVTVTVSDAGEGELDLDIVYSDDTEFNNAYEKTEGDDIVVPAPGETPSAFIWLGLFLLAMSITLLVIWKKRVYNYSK
jgi:pilin isopeptide linkage protein